MLLVTLQHIRYEAIWSFSMVQHQQWQQGGSAAEIYQREIVPRITMLWAKDLVDRVELRHGDRVLDVACGTGVVTRVAAERATGGQVIGLDLNAEMLKVARSQLEGTGSLIEWRQGSALALPFENDAFDVVLCQLGLQFFPDKLLAMQEMARILGASGRLALSVFSAIERTPVALALASALDRHLGTEASSTKRAEHSLSDPDILANLARDAGLTKIVVTPVQQTIRFHSSLEYVRLQLTATPQAQLISHMQEDEQLRVIEAIADDIAVELGTLGAAEEMSSPQECNVLTASLSSH
jgi:ubiquinone/menaquinone biosynthesis C-methylase UbiE